MKRFDQTLVIIRGAGDLASGVAARLHRCGFPVVMTELPEPLMVRRAVSFGEAVYTGQIDVEGITARRADDVTAARAILGSNAIPVLIDPGAACRHELRPSVLVDALVAKQNHGTTLTDAPLVIALGPGFTAGVDCHAVIETSRGHWLGRVIRQGAALPDTGVPGEIAGVRSPRAPGTHERCFQGRCRHRRSHRRGAGSLRRSMAARCGRKSTASCAGSCIPA